MEFKNKLGTVDAHNVNLNFKADSTDSHNIILNFEHLADGSTNLNFGDDVSAVIDTVLDTPFQFEISAVYVDSGANTAVIDTVLDTTINFDIVAVFSENIHVKGQIDTVLDTIFSFEIEAVFSENLCTIDTVLDTEFRFEVQAYFDINHIVGVSHCLSARYQKAIKRLSINEIPWSKPILRVSNEALFFDRGLVLSQQVFTAFDRTNSLARSIKVEHEKSSALCCNAYLAWDETSKLFLHDGLLFDETLKLHVNRITDWQEMIRRRKAVTYAHELAKVFEKQFSFEWDKGLEIVTTDKIAWDKAKAIHYRKHPILPWPSPEIPEYVGSNDLNFICLCDVDSHNVVLNFGADDCIPAIPNKKGWYILNTLKATRLDNGEEITVYNGSYNTDRSRWCWSYSLVVPAYEISKLEPINGQPVIIKIMVNGTEHQMLLEKRTRSRSFAKITYTLTGRSQTALLDAPYSATRSFLQENERTSVQLAQAEIDRSSANPDLNWKLIDDLGWIVANPSLSYTNQTPIAAIKMVAESGGGFIYSEKGSNTLTIKPQYKKTYWDSMEIADYDRLIPESIVLNQSTDFELYPDYNAITLTNDRSGATGQVKRTGTAGDLIYPSENNPLFNHVSMTAFGKSKLAKAGMVETHTFDMPIDSKIGECSPGEIFAFNAEWWGIIDSVSVSFTHSKVNQSVVVERVNNE